VEDRGKPWFAHAVGIAERFADGVATEDHLRLAQRQVVFLPTGPLSDKEEDVWAAARKAAAHRYWSLPLPLPTDEESWQLAQDELIREWEQEDLAKCQLLRDIFGNPFRQPSPLPRSLLEENDNPGRAAGSGCLREPSASSRLPGFRAPRRSV
jgi:hypothetical protein